jgi:hypothetical protein
MHGFAIFFIKMDMKSIIVGSKGKSSNLFIVNNIKHLGNNSGGYDWCCIWKVIKVDVQLRHHKHHWQVVGIVQKGGVCDGLIEKKKCSFST